MHDFEKSPKILRQLRRSVTYYFELLTNATLI